MQIIKKLNKKALCNQQIYLVLDDTGEKCEMTTRQICKAVGMNPNTFYSRRLEMDITDPDLLKPAKSADGTAATT